MQRDNNLTKRVEVLMTEELHQRLRADAKIMGMSVGMLIRVAAQRVRTAVPEIEQREANMPKPASDLSERERLEALVNEW